MHLRPVARCLAILLSLALLYPWLRAGAQRPSAVPHTASRPWRVCVSNFAMPPYLYNDPAHEGVAERSLIDAGRQVGLNVELYRYPIRRCRAMLDSQGVDATLAAPTPGNQQRLEFPMKGGAVDPNRRVGRIKLVWVQRAESGFEWDGRGLRGQATDKLLVGVRMEVQSAIEPLQQLGFRVDATSLSMEQLMRKVALKRIDLAVGLQEEVEFTLQEPGLETLEVLPRAFAIGDFHAAVRHNLTAEQREWVEAWWAAIGRLRDTPHYAVH